ncbi:baseplate J/gp47 family protein [Xanthobacter sp. VTT E-85241]|uniref:baseplate assembly protein n=1 Tax=Roseixanthobacter finlandensis TaxID=3119922 RepID=UPI0037280211
MSRRFEDIDLARLGAVPDLVPADFEAETDAIRAGFIARWAALRAQRPDLPPVDTLLLEDNCVTVLIEEVAFRVTLAKQSYNDAIRAVMLASTWGAFLEHRAAEFGLTRRTLDAGDPSASPPVAPTLESDDDLRARRQMAVEAISTAGPYGAYIWWALDAHPQVKSVAVYGPESGLVDPGEVLVVVLDRRGDGTADDQVLGAVSLALSPKERRPLTDRPVYVESASIISYDVDVTIHVLPGPDIDLIRGRALERVSTYVADRHRINAPATRAGIEAAATVLATDGRALVEEVTVASPVADLLPGLKEAAFAASVSVRADIISD